MPKQVLCVIPLGFGIAVEDKPSDLSGSTDPGRNYDTVLMQFL